MSFHPDSDLAARDVVRGNMPSRTTKVYRRGVAILPLDHPDEVVDALLASGDQRATKDIVRIRLALWKGISGQSQSLKSLARKLSRYPPVICVSSISPYVAAAQQPVR
jgi:hypothetical protein